MTEDSANEPAALACETCGAADVRLFRAACSFDIELKCARCLSSAGVPRLGDRFEWWVPACQTPGGGFYQYTTVPPDDAAKWYALPESADVDEG